MDSTRRHFDDIDGCGGPPVGDPVRVADGGRGGGGGGGRRLRAIAGSGAGRVHRAAAPGGGRVPLANLTVDGRTFALALVTVALATAAALAVAASSGDVLDALLSSDPMGSLRRHAGPLVLAGAAFEAVLAVGLVAITRSNPFLSLAGITRDDLLRGFIAFLLALFAWTFVVGAVDGGGGRHWWPAAVGWLFVLEILLTALVAPLLEERLFRGYLLRGLRDRFGPVLGVLGQAAIYGAAHVWALRDASRPATIVGMAAAGAVFGWMAHASDDLKPVLVGHVMFGTWVIAERVLGW